ncbi:MAG: hypothetical protein MEPRV_02637 [Providencia sp.]|nr:hypothetical protein RB151_001190 [Providencia rettgeri]
MSIIHQSVIVMLPINFSKDIKNVCLGAAIKNRKYR